MQGDVFANTPLPTPVHQRTSPLESRASNMRRSATAELGDKVGLIILFMLFQAILLKNFLIQD
jgi:hypothetical protein